MQWLQYEDRENQQLNSYISLTNYLFLKKYLRFFSLYIRYAQRNDGLIVTYYKKSIFIKWFSYSV